MRKPRIVDHFALPMVLVSIPVSAAAGQTRTQNVIYLKTGGTALAMDVLKPAKPNNAGVIFLVSGGWMSDRSMLERLIPDIQQVFVDSGFTTFVVVHGAQPQFKVAEIVEQVRTAVRFVHAHAADYGIDTNRVGVVGISSGGHLALMVAGSADSPVEAVTAIAPPTDLLNWGKPDLLLTDVPGMDMFIPALGFDPKGPKTEIDNAMKAVSPISLVNPKYPPALIVQGSADNLVPMQQAESMDQALAKAGAPHK